MSSDADDTLREKVLVLLRSAGYQPLTKSGLARVLGLPPDERARFRGVLRGLEDEGVVLLDFETPNLGFSDRLDSRYLEVVAAVRPRVGRLKQGEDDARSAIPLPTA